MTVPRFWVGNLNPSITQTILNEDGTPHDLTGQTVRFRMRAIGAATMKVDQPATIVNPPGADGKVRYDWTGTDLDTAGEYLAWWQVTTTVGGKTQDVGEAIILVDEHGASPALYVEPEELKQLLDMSGTSYADPAVRRACQAASQIIELECDRRFWLDAAPTTRLYTPDQLRMLQIEDLVTLTSLKIDRTGSGSFTEVWTAGTDFILEPQNAPVWNPPQPYTQVRCRYLTSRYFPTYLEQSVQVIGIHGWLAIPEEIKTIATIIASKLLQRVRSAPFGIVAVGGPETGIAQRIARTDPDVAPVIEKYKRSAPWA